MSYGGMTSDSFGTDIVEQVKARKAAAEAAAAAKLEAARRAVMEEATARHAVQDAARAKVDAQQAAIEQARQAAEEQRERTLALAAWKAAGGTAAQFEDAWPEMRAAQVRQRVTRRAEQQAADSARFYKGIF